MNGWKSVIGCVIVALNILLVIVLLVLGIVGIYLDNDTLGECAKLATIILLSDISLVAGLGLICSDD